MGGSLMKSLCGWGMAIGLAANAFAPAALAVEMQPDDFIPAPAGTFLFLDYNYYAKSTELDVGGAKLDADFESYVNLLRAAYYYDLGPFAANVNFILPVVDIPNVNVAGTTIDGERGVGDPILITPVWFVSNKETKQYLSVVGYYFIPLGNYDRDQPINAGTNRWAVTGQIGYWGGITEKLGVELWADGTWYQDNDDFTAASATLAQDATYTVGAWLRYDFSPKTYAALGYYASMGGAQSVNGVDINTATEFQRIRVAGAHFIAKEWQLYGEVAFDVAREDGFRQDVGTLIRLLKIF